jgi:hypothetical protein
MQPIGGNIAFQALSLGVLVFFCWTVYMFRGQAVRCLKSTLAFSRTSNPRPEAASVYNNFLIVAMILGALSVGLAVVKVGARLMAAGTGHPGTIQWRLAGLAGTEGLAGIPSWVAPAAALAVALGAAGVAMAGMGVLKVAGELTLSSKFTDEIIRTKKNWMAAAAMLTFPMVAMWTGVNPERDMIIMYLLATMTVTLAILFAVQTLGGFIRQKVSLLVWFLYLCTVEILPLCAVTLAVARNV